MRPTFRPDSFEFISVIVSCSHLAEDLGSLAEEDARGGASLRAVATMRSLEVIEAQEGLQVGVDVGPVLASEEVPIHPDDTLESLETRIHTVEHRLLVDTIRHRCEQRTAHHTEMNA